MKIKENLKIKGQYKIRTYKTPKNWLENLLIRFGFKKRKLIRETDWIDNLIVLNENNGLYLVLNRLLGIDTYDLEITQAKIGTSDTAAQSSDTDLIATTLANIPVAVRSRVADDEIQIEFFIPDGDLADGDYKEFGIFCTNQLFARSIITPTYTKSENEDSQIDYRIKAGN